MKLSAILILPLLGVLGCQTFKPGGSKSDDNFSNEAKKRMETANDLCSEGGRLDPKGLIELQEELKKNPNDLDIHTKLWGYYNFHDSPENYASEEEWLLQNHSADGTMVSACNGMIDTDVNYEKIKQKWLALLKAQPKNYNLRLSVVKFLSLDRVLSDEILVAGYKYFPNDFTLHQMRFLKHDGAIKIKDSDKWGVDFKIAKEELAYLQEHFGIEKMGYVANAISKYSYLDGNKELAKKQARDLLREYVGKKNGWEFGELVDSQHSILGHIAIDEKNLIEAKSQLLDSVVESPVNSSFGPNFYLAERMLNAGAKEAVVEYLESYENIWVTDGGNLKKWIQQIKDGRKPSFDKFLG